tara:strand:- start:620 stop:811 length:192 start_codon:yes stop_codon:yes gene_type:complete
MRDPKDNDLVHILDLKEEKVLAVNNLDLCCFVNEEMFSKEKRFLLVPNAHIAEQVIKGEKIEV